MINKIMSVNIENLPEYPAKKYVVARVCEGSCWFYGSWDQEPKALEVAKEIGGFVATAY